MRIPRAAFTLMELLVVITIIAALVAMLLPTIKMVREGALTVRCLSHLRQFAIASDAYASDNRGSLAPCSDAQLSSTGQWWGGQCYWPTLLNPYLSAKPDNPTSNSSYNGSITSKNLAWGCPAWRGRNYSGTNYATTSSGYGYNKNPGLPTIPNLSSLGDKIFKCAGIENPSSRLMFCDSNDWHQYFAPSPAPGYFPTKGVDGNWAGTGGVRHRNGINILFFDGRAATVPLTAAANTFNNPAVF